MEIKSYQYKHKYAGKVKIPVILIIIPTIEKNVKRNK